MIGIIYLVLFAWFCVNFGLFVTSVAKTPSYVTPDVVVYNFYHYGGVPLAGFACVVIFTLIGGKTVPVLSKFFLWAVLLFAFNYASLFFANIFNLSAMTFMQGFTWLSDYLPSLMLCVILVALLAGWDSANKQITHAITWIGILFSIFMAGYVIFYVVGATNFSEVGPRYSGGFQITHAVILPVCIAWFFCITRNSEIFIKVFSKDVSSYPHGGKDEK